MHTAKIKERERERKREKMKVFIGYRQTDRQTER